MFNFFFNLNHTNFLLYSVFVCCVFLVFTFYLFPFIFYFLFCLNLSNSLFIDWISALRSNLQKLNRKQKKNVSPPSLKCESLNMSMYNVLYLLLFWKKKNSIYAFQLYRKQSGDPSQPTAKTSRRLFWKQSKRDLKLYNY